jgi:aspartate racemase
MKTLGIIGGLGPDSTIDYYRLLLASYRAKTGSETAPSLFINSLDVERVIKLITNRQHHELAEYLDAEIERLALAGADLALIAANTPHIVFDHLVRVSRIPLISIVESACDGTKALGLKRVALLGTRFTMQGDFYPKVFSAEGVGLVSPRPDDQEYIHEKYMTELLKGQFLPETRTGLLTVMRRLQQEEHIDGILLAGTELPLVLGETPELAIPVLDTTKLHVEAAITRLLS